MSFWAELKRRNVFRVAAGYAVVAWLIVQVVSALDTPLSLPEWFDTVVILLIGIGFPIALVFAWAFELTPEGLRRTDAGSHDADGVHSTAIDYVLLGAVVLVGVVTLWGQFAARSESARQAEMASTQASSVAVLPFADMSPEGDQEYFGDGISEELINELTRLEGLDVTGRTSSFAFKGNGRNLRDIGAALNVGTILEGSVRKSGRNVRITAQLIDAANGYHIWSQTYDRELTDVFAIQEDIARSVAGALGVALGVGDRNQFRGSGTRSIEAYDAYLQGIALLGGGPGAAQAVSAFERATELDPNYAAAWAMLGFSIGTSSWTAERDAAVELQQRAHRMALRAVELDPESATAQSILGTMSWVVSDWVGSAQAHMKALELAQSSDSSVHAQYANMLTRAGRNAQAREQFSAAQRLDPLAPLSWLHQTYLAQRRYADAEREIDRLEELGWPKGSSTTIRLYVALSEGTPATIKTRIAQLLEHSPPAAALYAAVLRDFDSPDTVVSTLRDAYANESNSWPDKAQDIALMAAYFDAPDLALLAIGRELRDIRLRTAVLWHPVMAEVRALPGFETLVSDIGLVAYWRTYGWPDACRPLDDEAFECG